MIVTDGESLFNVGRDSDLVLHSLGPGGLRRTMIKSLPLLATGYSSKRIEK